MVNHSQLYYCSCGWSGYFADTEIHKEIKKGLLTYTAVHYCPDCGEKVK